MTVDKGVMRPASLMHGPPEPATEMMKPYVGAIAISEVFKDVGNVRNSKPEVLDRVALLGGFTATASLPQPLIVQVSPSI